MLIEARAKINWTLDITGVREDGYHLMDMLMQPVSLADDITLLPADSLLLTTSGNPLLPPDENHLALRAAKALREACHTEKGASIHVFKRIPVGAGMGGGSADAAAVLWGLNQLWDLNLSENELFRIGLTLGADVPFCLHGGLTRTTGIGEKMESLPCKNHYWLVVIQPCRGLSTKQIFSGFHEEIPGMHPDNDLAIEAFATGNHQALFSSLANVLQPVSNRIEPEIGRAIDLLMRNGARTALMTGSGSAVFGVFMSAPVARKALNSLATIWRKTWMCHTCEESLRILS